ncbi:ester cyclase [Sphaerisporangium perillae]|uniref:ester cyclase n=1 Tax=Sphaerisporangium perillae TaxID=2935860 RepID=UPI00200C0B06|nr:ester cyclase [Sphaerisporangium perillae]
MSDIQEVMGQMIGALNEHDLEAMMRCYSPEAFFVSPSGKGEGADEVLSFWALFQEAFPDLQLTPWRKCTCGDTVVMEWILTGTHKGPYLMPDGEIIEATNRGITIRGCSVRNFENGLIVTHCIYYDQLELLTQLGARLILDRPAD